MKEKTEQNVSLSLQADTVFLPLATSFVEKSALCLGLAQTEALALTLATEEIFSYLCQVSTSGQTLDIQCSSSGYYVRADFLFSAEHFNMRAFNLTTTISFDDESSLEEVGLLIASRSVDHLQVSQEEGRGLRLSLTKEKIYPELDESAPPAAIPLAQFSVRDPKPEELKIFAQMVNANYPSTVFPNAFRFPGKVVDMVGRGQYRAALAFGPFGDVGGGIVWHWAGLKTVECFGPYLFNQNPDSSMPEALLEACLGAIARTHAVGLLNRFPTDDLPQEHFEPLGALTIFDRNGSASTLTAYFRQMQEDPGSSVWSHPELEGFLRQEYGRLVLPREIRPARDQGETRDPFSVLSAEFDRSRGQVTLRPLRIGKDAEENLVNHLKLFRKESINSIFFEMDLAEPWHTEFTPPLLKNEFIPRLVLPYAGQGDIVVFQWGRMAS